MVEPLSVGVYLFLFVALYFEVFLLITFLEKRPRATLAVTDELPTVAVIVPCFNEERTVAKTIASLLNLHYPHEKLSVLVVDDGSTDNTYEIASAFCTDSRVTVFRKENGGKHTALNHAIAHTKAELIGCLDADSFVEPGALMEVVTTFMHDPHAYAVTPAIKVERPRNLLEYMQRAEYGLSVFYRRMFARLGALFVVPGPFSFYRREVFDRIGPFRHAHNTEDMEMAMRMHAHRLRIVNTPTARVYTVVPRTVRALVRQRVRWVQGFLENSKDYAFMYFSRRYGNLGVFILPLGLMSVFSALYLAGYTLYSLWLMLERKLIEVSAIGVSPSFHYPSVQAFVDHTSTLTILVATVIPLTILIMALGKRMGGERPLNWDMAAYLFLYAFIAPLWLARAAWNATFARKMSWR